MRKLRLCMTVIYILAICLPAYNPASAAQPANGGASEEWTLMPAGARPSYMGIHGGTMPVSLLVSPDGAALITFVGRTGNDFMEVLRRGALNMPTFAGSILSSQAWAGKHHLFAGNATASMPVVAVSGEALAGLESHLQPFGLSSEPSRLEGQPAKPASFPHARSLRSFSFHNFFGGGK